MFWARQPEAFAGRPNPAKHEPLVGPLSGPQMAQSHRRCATQVILIIFLCSVGQLAWKCPSPETVGDMDMMPENAGIISATLPQLFREFLRL